MSDKYTLEEIKKKARKLLDDEVVDALITELTKPPVKFAEGEVIAVKEPTGTHYYKFTDIVSYAVSYAGEVRKLTTTEAGAGELVEALEYALSCMSPSAMARDATEATLDKWKGDRDE